MNIHLPAFTLDRRAARRICLFALLLIFCAHAFCFFNPTYSGASVMVNAAKGTQAQTESGRWMQPLYFAVRGAISAPLVSGVLSALYLTAAALVIADLLAITAALPSLMLCCVLCVNPYVISVFAASLHTADALFLAQLLAAAGVWLSAKARFGFLPGACLIGSALALDAGAGSFSAVLAYISLIASLLDGEGIRPLIKRMLRLILAVMIALALHMAGYFVLLRARGLDGAAAMQSMSAFSAWFAPIRSMLAPLTAYPHVSLLLRALLAALTLAALTAYGLQAGLLRAALVFALCVFLPLQAALPIFSSEPASQVMPAYALLDLLPIVLICRVFSTRRVLLCRLTAGVFAVLTLGFTVFSNQVYLKKNLESHATLSVMTRIVDRFEQTEGFKPGYTPVAFVGTLDKASISMERVGFDHLAALDAAQNRYAITSNEDMVWYSWEILGYPLSFVSYGEMARMAKLDEVRAMPSFPAEGSLKYVDDVLVIKLSENE